MLAQISFKYFYSDDIERYSFFRIPKQLFTLEPFKGLSSDAKILYALMLDRVSLSLKNKWVDDDKRVYIYFSVEDVMDQLGCGKNKAIKCLKELDVETGIGLIQKRRQGLGKTNIIYVKTFHAKEEHTSGSPDNKLPDVCKEESNNIKKSKNNSNDNKSHRILSLKDGKEQKCKSVDEIRFDKDKEVQPLTSTPVMPYGEPRDRSTMIQAYQTLIRKNIDYDNLMTFPDVDHELAQEIYELIVETVLCLGKEIVISSNRYPTEVVRSRFLKINYMHIRYVMECLPRLDQLQRQLNNSIFLNPVCQQH